MVTKPTGRPRGRPRKAKAPMLKKKRGRPEKPFAARLDKYTFAFLQYHIDCAIKLGFSERNAAELLAKLTYCRFVESTKNAFSLLNGAQFDVAFAGRFKGKHSSELWRDGNNARPYADDLLRQLRRFRKNKEASAWLSGMSRLYEITFMQDDGKLIEAQELSEFLSERAFFERNLRSILMREDDRYARIDRFFRTGDTTYWRHNRLKDWPSQSVSVAYGEANLLKHW